MTFPAPASDAPLFRQLASDLARTIAAGELRVGEVLPTEMQLMSRYAVSRHTVRAALAELKARGIVAARRGIGTIVLRADEPVSYVEAYSSINELFTFAAGRPISPTAIGRVTAEGDLAHELRCPPGRRFLRIEGLRGGAKPVAHVVVHVEERYAGIEPHLAGLSSSIAEKVEETYGVRIDRIEQEIDSTVVDEEMAALLDVEPDTPALAIRRWYFASSTTPIEVARSIYPSGRFTYRNTLVRR